MINWVLSVLPRTVACLLNLGGSINEYSVTWFRFLQPLLKRTDQKYWISTKKANDNCYPSRLKIPQIPVELYWQNTHKPFRSIYFSYQPRCIPVTINNQWYGIFKIYRDLPRVVSELSHSASSSPRSLSLLIPAMLAFAWNGSCRNVSWIWTGWLRGCEVFLLSNMFNSTSSLFCQTHWN